MTQTNLLDFIHRYFHAYDCLCERDAQGIKVQLSEAEDKKLMNRPFYWHYREKIGLKGVPMTRYFHTDQTLARGPDNEYVEHAGLRVKQLENEAVKHGSLGIFYEQTQATEPTPLIPWLLVNGQISYQCQNRAERTYSVGIQLHSGEMHENMMHKVSGRALKESLSNYHYTLNPIIKYPSAVKRVHARLLEQLQQESTDWAFHALKERDKELQLLHHVKEAFEPNYFKKKEKEIESRYTPIIELKTIQTAVIYLKDRSLLTF
ncbi:hypothetical protein FLK61_29885 [Paenalkalicoccus suaedae]|uniref:YqhG family protein n=1 Tax=Paenalkalicoccus suaedae TaxID=2592382 RepID=A0A859FFC6_9BACI|nr:YqhG family protein [Paenalkalicoccus suaedae]QKS70936.1 hypothetical protein FLK61_29885 [Paenalkalicoccus suaedae]